MSKKNLEISSIDAQVNNVAPTPSRPVPVRTTVFCTLIYILCTLVSVAPLLHLAGKTFLLSLPTNAFLLWWGSWLPSNLHLASTYQASMITTTTIEFLLLMALAFAVYGLSALFVQRQQEQGSYKQVMRVIVLGTIIIGMIYVFTPAMLSRDIFVYAGYGRTMAAHHANPYFVTPSAFPHDPITPYDDWEYATSAYGPLWLFICAGWSLLIGTSAVGYVLAYRLFGLAVHLVNILLIAAILKKFGRSPRTVALGSLLYAWNPLVLMETCLGGHNDTLLLTLILLGIFLSIRAEQHHFARPSDYLLPIVAFTLAALIKFTAAPIIAFYIVFLVYRTLHPVLTTSSSAQQKRTLKHNQFLLKTITSIIVSGLVALVFYAPFWIRHSIHDIIRSFSTPPSSYFSEQSILRAIYNWVQVHGMPAHSSWTYLPIYVFGLHSTWNIIDMIVLLCMVCVAIIWLWRVPTPHTLILTALATLGALLIVTPWFFAWYVIWLVGLAAACLPTMHNRQGRALVAFALTFSATSLITYLFTNYPPIGDWGGLAWLLVNVPPLCAFALFYHLRAKYSNDTTKAADIL